MKTSTQLQGGYLLVVLMMLVCAGAGYFGFVITSKQLDLLSSFMKEESNSIKSLQVKLSEQQRLADKLIHQTFSPETQQELEKSTKEIEEILSRLSGSASLSDKLGQLKQYFLLYHMAQQQLLSASDMAEYQQRYIIMTKQLLSTINALDTQVENEVQKQILAVQESRPLLQALIISCVLLGLFLSLLILATVRSMVRWLESLHSAVTGLAQGDLSIDFESQSGITSGQDLQEINQAMQSLLLRFSQVMNDLKSNTSLVDEISSKINHAALEISRGANDQASSLEETSASIEQMSATVSQNNHNANMTKTLATETAASAKSSGKTVFDMIEAMRHIAKKVSIIDDIAYQTNLLALNAAIEASRAGEDGRGFAVVASEVRKLAERSKLAASEVVALAKQILHASEEAGKEFINILPNIEKTAELVQEISAASDEQATGLREITFAVTQLDGVAQYNAKAARQLTAMAREMEGSIGQLSQLIQFFTLKS